ncbi:hypothetical protein E4U10_003394 [Claviceps purpurea]|nr:hypothetical protein E4U10_003394 [Claviceps purpurea]
MDPKHWNRTIEENPIANRLDVFHSFARQEGVCDITAVDRITAKDVRFLATELVVCLRSHPAAKILQGIHGSVSDDLTALSKSVTTGMVGEDSVRRLLKAAIIKAGDKTLWDEVLAFITASLTAIDTATRNRTIEENPIANGLDMFHSIARRKGVCDIAAVDRILTKGEWADIDPAGQSAGVNLFADVQYLATELVVCLRSHPAAKVLQGIHGSVSDDLIALSQSVTTGMVGEDSARRLLKAAIIKADDKTLWDEALAFITASLSATDTATRPLAPRPTEPQDKSDTAAQISTPRINVSEHHSLPVATVAPGCTVSSQSQSPSQC